MEQRMEALPALGQGGVWERILAAGADFESIIIDGTIIRSAPA
jgi:hypothetical protein